MRIFVIILLIGCKDGTDTDTDPPFSTRAPSVCEEVDRGAMGQDLVFDGQTTLSGVYRVDGRAIYDRSQVITVEPGTIFLMGPDSSLLFGWRGDPATVFMNGTSQAPVLFCGTSAGPDHWLGVELLSGTTADSSLSSVRIEDGGGGEAALLLQAEVDLIGVQLVGNGSVGLDANQLGANSDDLTITGNVVAAHLRSAAAITAFPEGSYAGNTADHVRVSGQQNEDVVFHDRGVPYVQLDSRVVYGRAGGPPVSVTFEAGVEYRFCQDCSLQVGWRGDPATITAVGTAEAPVLFTSAAQTPAPGDWNGMHLLSGTSSDSVLQEVRFEYGGKASEDPEEGANLMVNGGLGLVAGCTFADSAGWGIWLEDTPAGFSQTDSRFENNAAGEVFAQIP